MIIKIGDALTSRSYDDNGYLIVKDNPIAKAGVFDYLGSEVNLQENADEIVKVCRPFKDLEANKDLFKGKPIKFNHLWVGKGEDSDVAEGAIYGDVRADEPYLRADIIIYNPTLIDKINKGEVVELSPAYDANIVKENGTYNGEGYAYRQELKSVNHLAVVECGRSGSDLRIQDTKEALLNGGAKMKKKMKFKDAVVDLLKRFKDEEAESQGEVAEISDDKSDIAKEIVAIATKADTEFEGGENEKLEAILKLAEQLSQTQDEDNETETQDEEAEAEKETQDNDTEAETQDNDVEADGDKEISVDELVEVIEKIADSKIRKFKDSMLKETKRVNDTYSVVSKAIGTNFDYSGKSVSDIYKFGYEAISKQRLADGMDAKTAFLMVANKKPATNKRVSDSKSVNSKLDELIAKHK